MDRVQQRLLNTAAVHEMMTLVWESVLGQSEQETEEEKTQKSSNWDLGKGGGKEPSWQKKEERGADSEKGASDLPGEAKLHQGEDSNGDYNMENAYKSLYLWQSLYPIDLHLECAVNSGIGNADF